MSLSDKARQLAAKAQAYAAGNKDKINRGVQQAERAADTKTGGRYHDQITKAGQKAEDYVANLPTTPEQPPATQEPPAGHQPPADPGTHRPDAI